jgi:hypothetical protein
VKYADPTSSYVGVTPDLTQVTLPVIVTLMKAFRRRDAAAAAALVAAFLFSGCTSPAREQPPAAPPYRPVATIREVMNSVIDPSADVVWNSVASVVDNKGRSDRAPATAEDWAEVRRHALIVSEAANLLMMPDRPVAPPGAPSLEPGVELAPEQIQSLIDENRDGWNLYVQQLQDSLKPALAAIDVKNAEALVEAGEGIDTACENCHQVFWFPNAVASVR